MALSQHGFSGWETNEKCAIKGTKARLLPAVDCEEMKNDGEEKKSQKPPIPSKENSA